MWGIAKRFPASDRGAQAVYWLGAQAKTDAERIAIWERLRSLYPPEKFNWSANGMRDLFETYVRTDPPKALNLARAMSAKTKTDVASAKDWENRLTHARRLSLSISILPPEKRIRHSRCWTNCQWNDQRIVRW